MSHTREPWVGMQNGTFNNVDSGWSAIHDGAYCSSSAPIWADGEVVTLVVVAGDNDEKLKANARRIVACVNACAGIPTDKLGDISHVLSHRVEVLCGIVKQRDELLTSLKEVMLWIRSWNPEFTYDDDWPADRDRAEAAIVNAEAAK